MACRHVAELGPEPEPRTAGVCQECHEQGVETWAHLRLCLACGHVGCCDSSQYRHANAHFKAARHPVMRSAEPGESWRWCYVDKAIV